MAFENIFDILKIYFKLALITLIVCLVAEWYIVHNGIDLDDAEASLAPKSTHNTNTYNSNSTVIKVYRLLVDFFLH